MSALLNTPGGIAGSTITAILTIGVLVRKFLLTDKTQSATAQGHVDVIQALRDIADRADKRASEAEARADTAYRERNEAYSQIGALQEQVRYLNSQIAELRKQVDAKFVP